MRVLFLTQTNELGASARYRVYQYLDFLERNGLECIVSPAVNENILSRYNNNHRISDKIAYYSSIIFRRINDLMCAGDFDCIFLQRDILIHIYPFLENLIARRQKNIIFDFDDALFLYPPSKNVRLLFYPIWDKRKIQRIIKLSKHVIISNNFLKNYVENFTKNVTLIPNSIDLNLYQRNNRMPKDKNSKIVIGWIGSQLTFDYLERIFPVFIELAKTYGIELRVIGARGPQIKGIEITYKDWDLNTEIEDIYDFDIGVMPLTDDEWSKGKSGTKILQYMAAGIAAVASPVGVNNEIIKNGINGFLVNTNDDWINKISIIIEDQRLRRQMINNARDNIEKYYSVQVNAPKLIEIFRKVSLSN